MYLQEMYLGFSPILDMSWMHEMQHFVLCNLL